MRSALDRTVLHNRQRFCVNRFRLILKRDSPKCISAPVTDTKFRKEIHDVNDERPLSPRTAARRLINGTTSCRVLIATVCTCSAATTVVTVSCSGSAVSSSVAQRRSAGSANVRPDSRKRGPGNWKGCGRIAYVIVWILLQDFPAVVTKRVSGPGLETGRIC